MTKDWNQSSRKYCLPLSISPISFRVVQVVLAILLLVPILPWILWQNYLGVVLSSLGAILFVVIEPGISYRSQEIEMVRVDYRGRWHLSFAENIELDADCLDCWCMGGMVVVKCKSVKNYHTLIFWRTRENQESFHRLRLCFL